MEETAQSAQTVLGNTKSQNLNIRARRWCITLNNYTEEEYNTYNTLFQKYGWKYVIGKEVGSEKNTPHLQIYIETKNPISFNTLKKINNKFHIEKAKGNRDDNLNYCSKDGNFVENISNKKVKDPLEGLQLKDFQLEIMNIINEEPDDRKIHWYWDENGNIGKTTLAKSICLRYPKKALFLGGKGNDVKFGVKSFLDNEENELKICIFHFTRSVENFVSYEAIESIKDGIFFNSKYESGMVIFNSPHIICFANFKPHEDRLSKDRWVIKDLSKTNKDDIITINENDNQQT